MRHHEFSVPYNGDTKLLPELFELNKLKDNGIREIYLSGPSKYSGSGRIMPDVSMGEFIRVVDEIHKNGIRVNLAMNSTCEGSEWYSRETIKAAIEYLRQVHKEQGVEAVTMANPLYIQAVREHLPDIEICASVLGNIDCVQRAIIYHKAGADTITPDVNINRNLSLLKEIKEATNARLKLLVNEGCLYKCPFRQFHFNAKSHVSKEVSKPGIDVSFADFFGAGTQVIREDLSQLLKSCWIRPEDIRKYSEITTYFKLVCRSQLRSFAVRATKAYLEESYDGDLFDLVSGCSKRFSMKEGAYLNNKSLDDCNFFKMVSKCKGNCRSCNYCRDIANDLIEIGVYTPEKAEDSDHEMLENYVHLMQKDTFK